ncbi:MAG: DUF928 domain-containing protein [Xenococcaceae cyanobacterium MO_188.B19]|nr:DUF928 domain-containing protein [Xenococcaceae cyanobacterium MO_188.B19]
MFYKILGFSSAIILAGSLIEGTSNPAFATKVGEQLASSSSNPELTINDKFHSLTDSYQIAQARTYRVRLGDTLGGIANRYGISFRQLLSYNPQLRSRPNLIYVGEKINVGGRPISTSTPVSGRKYTVRRGDTLGGIAIRHGLSLRTILSYNPHLASRSNNIRVGEKINVGSAQVIQRTRRGTYTPPRRPPRQTTVSTPSTPSGGNQNQQQASNPTPPTTTTRRSIFNNLTTERRSGSNNTGSKRGPGTACTQAGRNLRAIAPSNGLGFTFDDYPYFFWYFPGVEYAQGIDFMLFKQTVQEETGELEHTRVYRQKLNLDKSGIIAFPLPADKSQPLEEGEEYRWRIRIKCTGRTAMNLSYSIKRQPTDNPELIAKLEAAPVDQHPLIFAESGVWFDALKMIALQLEQTPENPVLKEDWNDVLREIKFDDLIGEPIQYIEPILQE